jgi:hypothetical protein
VGSYARAATATSAPDAQRASAAVSPAGPAPITMACVVNSERMRYVLEQFLAAVVSVAIPGEGVADRMTRLIFSY